MSSVFNVSFIASVILLLVTNLLVFARHYGWGHGTPSKQKIIVVVRHLVLFCSFYRLNVMCLEKVLCLSDLSIIRKVLLDNDGRRDFPQLTYQKNVSCCPGKWLDWSSSYYTDVQWENQIIQWTYHFLFSWHNASINISSNDIIW